MTPTTTCLPTQRPMETQLLGLLWRKLVVLTVYVDKPVSHRSTILLFDPYKRLIAYPSIGSTIQVGLAGILTEQADDEADSFSHTNKAVSNK